MSYKGKTITSDDFFRDIKLLTASEIEVLVSMNDAIQAMEQAFLSFSSGRSQVPQRYVSTFDNTSMDLFLKPAYSKDIGRAAIKIITQNNDVSRKGTPGILGVVLLVDLKTGAFLSMMDGACITALRTGAASGIATKYLAIKEAQCLAIFGCGAQARTQFEAVCKVRTIKELLLYDINIDVAKKFKEELDSQYAISTHIERNLTNLKRADIICTATNAERPLFSLHEIKTGVHINAVGSYKPNMQEIDPHILKEGTLYVDSRESVLQESGDLIKPINSKTFTSEVIKAEIGELFNSKVSGRKMSKDITIFKSVGLGVQDLFMAHEIYKKYTKANSQ